MPPTTADDGRRARTDRGKQAAIDALVRIFAQGQQAVTMAQIAEEAGISERTLFRYFTTQDQMIDAAAKSLFPQLEPYFVQEPPRGGLETRIRALLALRGEFIDKFGHIAGTVELHSRRFETAGELRRGRDELFRLQLEHWLGDARASMSDEAFVMVDLMCGFQALQTVIGKLGHRAIDTVADSTLAVIRADVRRA